jgi:hypothetical protein
MNNAATTARRPCIELSAVSLSKTHHVSRSFQASIIRRDSPEVLYTESTSVLPFINSTSSTACRPCPLPPTWRAPPSVSGEEPLERQPACPQPVPGLSSPRLERQPVCWMCPPSITLGRSLLTLRAAPFAPNPARLPLLHHYVEACELIDQRHGHVPKVGMLRRVGKAGRPLLRRLASLTPQWGVTKRTSVEATLNGMPASTSQCS